MKYAPSENYTRAEVLHKVAWGEPDAYGYELETLEFTRPIARESWQWDNRRIG